MPENSAYWDELAAVCADAYRTIVACDEDAPAPRLVEAGHQMQRTRASPAHPEGHVFAALYLERDLWYWLALGVASSTRLITIGCGRFPGRRRSQATVPRQRECAENAFCPGHGLRSATPRPER